MTIGQSIKRARIERGISQSELSEMIGASQAIISLWECDRFTPCTYNLISIADAFDISLDELVGRQRR